MAKLGKYHDILHTDEVWQIRAEIAKQGKYLNKFYKDIAWTVRLEVAKQGYYHDILKNDKWKDVRKMVLLTPSKDH